MGVPPLPGGPGATGETTAGSDATGATPMPGVRLRPVGRGRFIGVEGGGSDAVETGMPEGGVGGAAGAGTSLSASLKPQCWQKLKPDGVERPQLGQAMEGGAVGSTSSGNRPPHCRQKVMPGGLVVPQASQRASDRSDVTLCETSGPEPLSCPPL